MKKITALIISFMLISSLMICPPVGAAGEEVMLDKEFSVLTQLGFLTEIPEELSSPITRGEFTSVLCEMMNASIVDTAGVVITDINEFHDYYPTMAHAIKFGLVSGPVTRPDDYITYNEAVKMAVCMIGYGEYALYRGGYPTGYTAMAHETGVLDGVISLGDGNLTWADAAKILYNSMNIDMLVPSSLGENITYSVSEGYTILTQSYGIKCDEGVVEGVAGKIMEKEDSLADDEILINGVKYKSDLTSKGDYVAHNVTYYYNYSTKALLAMYSENNNILEISAEEVDSFENNVVTYYGADDEEGTLKVSAGAVIMYNDVVIESFDPALFIGKQGFFKFVDNDADRKFDAVFLDVTEDYVVKLADRSSGYVYDLYDSTRSVCLLDSSDRKVSFVDEVGNKRVLNDLMRYDVISVKKSLDSKNVTAIYSNTEVYGSVEEIKSGDSAMSLIINGKEYKTTEAFAKYESVSVGDWGVFGITVTGKIATINRAFASETASFGYFIDASSSTGLDKVYKYKILDQSDRILVLNSAVKLSVDGNNMSAAEAYDYLGGESFASKPIKYETNANGEIFAMDTPYYNSASEPKDSLQLMYSSYVDDNGNNRLAPTELEWRVSSNEGIFGSKIPANAETVAFNVADSQDAPDEEWVSTGIEAFKAQDYYSIEAYKIIAESHYANIIIHKSAKGTAMDDYTNPSVIKNISYAIDEDGNALTKLTVIKERTESVVFVKDEIVFDKIRWNGVEPGAGYVDHDIAEGDVVRLSFDDSGYISEIELIYDRAGDKFAFPDTNYNSSKSNLLFRISKNEVYSLYNGNMYVYKGSIPKGTVEIAIDDLENYNARNFAVIVYDSSRKTDKVQKGDISDLIDYKTSGKGSKIILYTAYTLNGTIVVYK